MKRPFTAAAVAGAAAHDAFELGAGVGLVLQPELGLPGSLTLWGTVLPVGFVQAAKSSDGWERRRGLPWLTEAEGLRGAQLPQYNTLLYLWGGAAVAALVTETPKQSRRWAALGLASPLVFRKTAEYHFRWANE